jgi:gag-polyprotein putative aspartyl protease
VKFSYRAYEVEPTPASDATDGCIYRPVIPFTLIGPAGPLDFFGLLDTGADETYITRRMAERLGIEVGDAPTHVIESAGGEIGISYGVATIELTDGAETYRWRTTIGVTEQDWAEAILGHIGFQAHFDVLFRGEALEVEIVRNGSVLPG